MAGDQRLAGASDGARLPATPRRAGPGGAPSPTTNRRLPGSSVSDRAEEQGAQPGERRRGGVLGFAAAAGEAIAGLAHQRLDRGAPGSSKLSREPGVTRPAGQLRSSPSRYSQQQGVAVEQALDLGRARGARLGEGGVARVAGAQLGADPVELVPAARQLLLDRLQLRGEGVGGAVLERRRGGSGGRPGRRSPLPARAPGAAAPGPRPSGRADRCRRRPARRAASAPATAR